MDWEKQLRKVEHPVRLAIIDTLHTRNEPMTIADLALAVDEPLASVCYHLGALDKLGEVRCLQSTAPRQYEFVDPGKS